ncbi:MAG: heat-inducible transcriptional repressor HrcA [Micrococcales bacterium]|nr:heat-inducible transcriptional repressor HrcA [Micrococcales bacterium]
MDDRRLDVLRAIVQDYVSTREPVASLGLVQRHNLGVSPATIRNDMAALEEAGYITQPHTSAGRVPTDAGYRFFVDQLTTIKPLSVAERRAINALLEGGLDLDQLVERAVRALTQLTHQVAVVQYPRLESATLRHIELIPLEPDRCLVVLIAESGRVEQRFIQLPVPLDQELAGQLRAQLMGAAIGRTPQELQQGLAALPERFPPSARPAVVAVTNLINEALNEGRQDRVALAGTVNLARAGADFGGSILPLLEAIEEQVVLLKLLGEMATDDGKVVISIGRENPHPGLAEASLVATTYGSDGPVGSLGVLGPTRMDYPGSIAVVRAIALYLSRILAGEEGIRKV